MLLASPAMMNNVSAYVEISVLQTVNLVRLLMILVMFEAVGQLKQPSKRLAHQFITPIFWLIKIHNSAMR